MSAPDQGLFPWLIPLELSVIPAELNWFSENQDMAQSGSGRGSRWFATGSKRFMCGSNWFRGVPEAFQSVPDAFFMPISLDFRSILPEK